jgi:hypothetical protein
MQSRLQLANAPLLSTLQRGRLIQRWRLDARHPQALNSAIEVFTFEHSEGGRTIVPIPRAMDDDAAMDCITISLGLAESELRRRGR